MVQGLAFRVRVECVPKLFSGYAGPDVSQV